MAENILEVNNLTTRFRTERGLMTAVQGVSFHVQRGEILGLVGESGCGKSVTSQTIMRLYDEKRLARYEGEILFEGKNLLKLTGIAILTGRNLPPNILSCSFACFFKSAYSKTAFRYSVMLA